MMMRGHDQDQAPGRADTALYAQQPQPQLSVDTWRGDGELADELAGHADELEDESAGHADESGETRRTRAELS